MEQRIGQRNSMLARPVREETMDEYLETLLYRGDGTDWTSEEYMDRVRSVVGTKLFGDVCGVEPERNGNGVRLRVNVYVPGRGSFSMYATMFADKMASLKQGLDMFHDDIRNPTFMQSVVRTLDSGVVEVTGTAEISSRGKPYFKIGAFHVEPWAKMPPTMTMDHIEGMVVKKASKMVRDDLGMPVYNPGNFTPAETIPDEYPEELAPARGGGGGLLADMLSPDGD